MNCNNRIYSINLKLLQKGSFILFSCWAIVQIILLCIYWEFPLHDDAAGYASIALGCLKSGTWYPNASHMYSDFIFAPGYVNLLIFIGRISGDLAFVKIVNLFLNLSLSLGIFYLARKLFNKHIAYFSLILFCILYSNAFIVIAPLSDIPFTWCMVFSACLVVHRKWYSLVLAGVLLAIGNWIRPLAIVYLIPLLIYMVCYKYKAKTYFSLGVSILLIVFVIGKGTEQRSGSFSFQSSTSGFNLAMSSFEGASGLVNFNFKKAAHFQPFIAKSDSMNYKEKDRMLTQISLQWIKEHPGAYLRQMPFKLAALFCMDTWPERVLPNKGLYQAAPGLKENPSALLSVILSFALKSLCYYFLLFLFISYLWTERKRYFKKEKVFLLIPVLGVLATLPFVITERYHYPFLPFMTIYAAAMIYNYLNKKNYLNLSYQPASENSINSLSPKLSP